MLMERYAAETAGPLERAEQLRAAGPGESFIYMSEL